MILNLFDNIDSANEETEKFILFNKQLKDIDVNLYLQQLENVWHGFSDQNSDKAKSLLIEYIKESIDSFIMLGVDHFMFWFMDYPDHNSITRFAKEVIPLFNNR